MRGVNSGRVGGCDGAALCTNDAVLKQAISLGNRATQRVAKRKLAKLEKAKAQAEKRGVRR